MSEMVKGSASLSLLGSDYNDTNYIIRQILMSVNTAIPVQVIAVKGGGVNKTGYVNVKVLVDMINVDGEIVSGNELFNLPFVRIQGGLNACIIDPEVGDIGLAVFCHRDISTVKNSRKSAPPPSNRILSASDGIYIGGILNGTPTRYAHLHNGGIDVVAPDKISLNAPVIEINAQNSFTLNTQTNTVNSPTNSVNGALGVTGGMTGGAGIKMKGGAVIDGIDFGSHFHDCPHGGTTGTPKN